MRVTATHALQPRAIIRHYVRAYGPVLLIAAGMTVFVLWQYLWLPVQYSRDVAGTPRQRGKATVLSVTPGLINNGNANPPDTVALRLNGQTVQALTSLTLRQGQPVEITYRLGRSGRAYVLSIDPLSRG